MRFLGDGLGVFRLLGFDAELLEVIIPLGDVLAEVFEHQDAGLQGGFTAGWKPESAFNRDLVKAEAGAFLDGGEKAAGDAEVVAETDFKMSHLAVGLIDPDGSLELF